MYGVLDPTYTRKALREKSNIGTSHHLCDYKFRAMTWTVRSHEEKKAKTMLSRVAALTVAV